VQGHKEQQAMHTNTKPQATSAAAGSENPRTGGSRTCSHSIPSDARCHCQAHPFDSPKAAVSWHFFRDFRRCVCSFRFQRIHNDFIDLSFKSCGIQLPACLHANLAPRQAEKTTTPTITATTTGKNTNKYTNNHTKRQQQLHQQQQRKQYQQQQHKNQQQHPRTTTTTS